MSRKSLAYLSIFAVVFATSFLLTRRVRSQDDSHRAFTAVQVEKRYDATGVERSQETRLYAVRSDGSSVIINKRSGPDGRLYEIGDIYDLTTGTVTTVDGLTESTVTQKIPEGDLAYRKSVDRKCVSGSEHSRVMGWDVVRIGAKVDSPDRSSEWTDWAAPELGCFALSRTDSLYKPKGTLVAKNSVETLFLIVGEPQASLFGVPATYKERSPSELADEYARKFGQRPFADQVLQRSMEKYQRLHR